MVTKDIVIGPIESLLSQWNDRIDWSDRDRINATENYLKKLLEILADQEHHRYNK